MKAGRKAMSEKELEHVVLITAQQLGYFRHGVRPAPPNRDGAKGKIFDPLKGDRGWVDLTLIGRGRAFFWELKADKGKLRPDQIWCRNEILAAGLNYAVIRPSQWRSGEVEQALMGREVDLPIE